MNSVYLTQCLCPERHGIFALAFEAETDTAALTEHEPQTIQQMEAVFTSGMIRRHCGICGSTELHYETGRTHYTDMKTAERELRKCQQANQLTRLFLALHGATADENPNVDPAERKKKRDAITAQVEAAARQAKAN